jgi:hypothetical protein
VVPDFSIAAHVSEHGTRFHLIVECRYFDKHDAFIRRFEVKVNTDNEDTMSRNVGTIYKTVLVPNT